MDYPEAKRLLLMHSFAREGLDYPAAQTAFLGTLRPYRGLRKENLREVMRAIEAEGSVRLEGWVDTIIDAVAKLPNGSGTEDALAFADEGHRREA